MVRTRNQSSNEATSRDEDPLPEPSRSEHAAAELLGARRRDPSAVQPDTPESPPIEDTGAQWRRRYDEHLRRMSLREQSTENIAGGDVSTPTSRHPSTSALATTEPDRVRDTATRATGRIRERDDTGTHSERAPPATRPRSATPAPAALAPVPTAIDRTREQVRFRLDERRAPSITSATSSTTEARKKQAELAAAERLAELRRKQMEIEEDLVKKRLEAELQQIEAEGSQAGGSHTEGHPIVDEWFKRTEVSDAANFTTAIPTPMRQRTTTSERADRTSRESRSRSASRHEAIDRLADHLENMARPPPKQVYELPFYYGHPSEWLTFYHSYTESTKRYKFSNFENMARLRAALRGEARECVQHMLAAASSPELIIRILKKNFGRTDLLIDRALEDLKRLPTLGPSATDLNTFAIKVMNIVSTLMDIDKSNYASNPLLIREVTDRLSPHLRSRWCSHARDNVKKGECEIMLLAEFLLDESDAELQFSHARAPPSRRIPTTNSAQHNQSSRRPTSSPMRSNFRRPQLTKAQTYATERATTCLCCGNTHRTTECRKLLGMSVGARWEWARENRVCYRCLEQRHRRETCTARMCGIPGCPHAHNRLLHETTRPALRRERERASETARGISPPAPDPAPSARPTPRPATAAHAQTVSQRTQRASDDGVNDQASSSETTTNTVNQNSRVMLKIMPILIKGPRGEVETFAMIDDGSTISLIDKDLADEIGAEGPEAPLEIRGVGSISMSQPSQRIKVSVRARNGGSQHTLALRTVANLGLRSQHMPRDTIDRFNHLTGLGDACYDKAVPKILIGADHWHLTLPIESRIGRQNEPAGIKTRLGWVIYGLAPRYARNKEIVMHLFTEEERDLNETLRRYFTVESLGVKAVDKLRPQDERAMKIFNDTARRIDGPRYEVGQLWRKDDPDLPPSYAMAYNRLRGIERKMDRDPQFAAEYTAQINNLLDKGYAEKHEGTYDSKKTWFLPHFAVRNINKGNKVRLVYDSHASSQKTSLNDNLLEGPDLLQSLPGILCRFREGQYAVSADIQEMFLQIRMIPEDQMSQLFLWRGSDRELPPQVYRMKSLIFGNTSSPFIAHSVRNRNALDNAEIYPNAVYDITTNHYMDDLIASYDTEQQAIDVAGQISASHALGGFNLRSWSSNSHRLRQQIPPEKRADDVTSLGTKGQKVLGLYWDPKTDKLSFNTSLVRVPTEVRQLQRGPTKREALSVVMSLYDPLGYLSQYSITGKILLQELWALKLSWDSPLPTNMQESFKRWMNNLTYVSELELPRRCIQTEGEVTKQLHVCVDASEQAYAAAAYWRTERRDTSEIAIHLAAAKSKVTPVSRLSIPRAELQAALIGARLATMLCKEHRIKPDQIVFWTDSRTVLHWIRENARRYSTFVSHRLGEIAELTKPDQWRWIPTKLNTADDATRADPDRVIKNTDRWYVGPEFLYGPEAEWPQETRTTTDEPPIEITEEVNTERCYATRQIDPPLPQIDRFSNYDRLLGATARSLLFIERIKKKEKVPLETRHTLAAEHLWYQWAQRRDFPDELRALSRGKPIARDSRLYDLDPELREDGVMYMRGRINAAPSSINKSPVILDGRNPFVKLLILRAHKRAHHGFNETVVNNLRQEFWILNLRPAVRSVARSCMLCVLRRTRPRVPPLGDMPPARLQPFTRAFTYCAVDLFGPLTVAIGRRREKRWVALYTCLTTRAVHMEIVHSLSTDSAVMSLRRFAARRGWPKIMYSDNGSNLRGSDAELRAAYIEWLPELQQQGMMNKMKWQFIAPGAPNMGGAWERMIRSVKTALAATLHTKTPREEILATLLAEVEYSLNSRPLTHVSVDPNDPEAITPNHFLLGGPAGVPLTGPCEEADRRTWRSVQALADHWWSRWLKEYLPTLAPRRSSMSREPTVAVGDYVLITDNNMPRNVWPRGIVEAVYPGPDGAVRNVDVRTRGGVFRRPTSRLAVLPITNGSPLRSDRRENVTDSEQNNT